MEGVPDPLTGAEAADSYPSGPLALENPCSVTAFDFTPARGYYWYRPPDKYQ
jgi:hypothetical protein